MPDVLGTSRSLHLFTEGFLPGWAGIVLFAAGAWFVLYQLRREFADIPVRRSLRVALHVLRVLIVALLAWLICRPVLKVIRVDTYRPTLLVLVDDARSMTTRVAFGHPHRKLDLIELLEDRTIENRDRYGSAVSRAAELPARLLSGVVDMLGSQLANMEKGLPISPDGLDRVRTLATEIPAAMAPLDAVRARTIDTIGKELQGELDGVVQAKRDLDALLTSLAADAAVVVSEAPDHADLLRNYIARLNNASISAGQLREAGATLQDRLDAALIPEEALAAVRAIDLSRRDIAQRAAAYIGARAAHFYTIRPGRAQSLPDCLATLLRDGVTGAAHAAVLVSDGSTPPTSAARDALAALRRTGVPVHAVLVESDGVEPSDAGLVSIDVPPVGVRGVEMTVRALVKYALADGARAELRASTGDTVLATRDLAGMQPGTRPVELVLAFPDAGRRQLAVELVVEGGDDFTGNERHVRTIDILPRPARCVLLCDGLSGNAAAYSAAAVYLNFLDPTVLLGAEEMAAVEVGREADMFPARRDDWEGTVAAVLIGPVPAELTATDENKEDATTLDGLLQAVEDGLHVCIQETVDPGHHPAWTDVFGLEVRHVDGPSNIRPVDGLHPDLRRLGRDDQASDAMWERLRAAEGCTVVRGGISLLECEEGPVVAVIPRGRGHIVYCGIRDLGQLRGPDTSAAVNRIVSELLALTVRPLGEGDTHEARFLLFPPQPSRGSVLVLRGDAATPVQVAGGLAPLAGVPDRFRVTAAEQVDLAVSGNPWSRLVHVPLGPQDFALTPQASRLRQVTDATGGVLVETPDLASLPPLNTRPPPRTLTRVDTYVMWKGWWPLPLVLLLASAEYLARRRAGRVM